MIKASVIYLLLLLHLSISLVLTILINSKQTLQTQLTTTLKTPPPGAKMIFLAQWASLQIGNKYNQQLKQAEPRFLRFLDSAFSLISFILLLH